MSPRTRRLALFLLALFLSTGSLVGEDKDQDKPATPAEQYNALLKEYQVAASGGARSDEE